MTVGLPQDETNQELSVDLSVLFRDSSGREINILSIYRSKSLNNFTDNQLDISLLFGLNPQEKSHSAILFPVIGD